MTRTEEQKLRHALYMRKWNRENPDKRRAIQRRYIITHRERIALWRKKFYEKHPDAHYRWNKTWRQKNFEKYCIQRTRRRLRREKRGFVPIAPNVFNVPTDWHHLAPNQPYVVAVPSNVHQAVFGKQHYVFNASIVASLYNLNLKGET